MAYKIKNVTNLLDKRHPFLNTDVDINYNKKNVLKEKVSLKVGEELIFDSDELPISIHNLRIKKFIRVTKISENEVHGLMGKENEPKPTIQVQKLEQEKTSKNTKKHQTKQEFNL